MLKLLPLLGAVLLAGCGSSKSDDSSGGLCKTETFALSGDLDTAPFDVTLPLGNFGYSTLADGDVSAAFGTGGKLSLTHPSPLTAGKPVAVSGTLTLPDEAPTHGGETLCVGQGSTFTEAPLRGLTDAVTFTLTGFSSDPSCATALAGSLDGCFTHTFEAGP